MVESVECFRACFHLERLANREAPTYGQVNGPCTRISEEVSWNIAKGPEWWLAECCRIEYLVVKGRAGTAEFIDVQRYAGVEIRPIVVFTG